jgi:hypothetical protein
MNHFHNLPLAVHEWSETRGSVSLFAAFQPSKGLKEDDNLPFCERDELDLE